MRINGFWITGSSEISTEDAAVLMETLMQEMRRGGYEILYRHELQAFADP